MAAQLEQGPGLAAAQARPEAETDLSPALRVRGRSVMALVISPEPPFAAWFSTLDRQMRTAGGFFADRPVVVDLAAVVAGAGVDGIAVALEGLEARGLRVIGAEGVRPAMLERTRWSRLATTLHGRETHQTPRADPPAPSAPSLLVERPVRSGQSIVFEDGDVTVVGAVASGADVIAGGSIHVYGALRGRALAGLKFGGDARIFCRRLEAELVGVDQLYRTAEHWGPGLHGRAAMVRCDRGALQLTALD